MCSNAHTHTHTWCYPTRSSCALAHSMLHYLKFTCSHALVHLMLRQLYAISYGVWTHVQWQANLMLRYLRFMCMANLTLRYVKFMCAGTQTWCCITWSSCAVAQQLDATLLRSLCTPVHLMVSVARIYIYIYLLQICLQVSRRHANLQIDDRMRGYFVSKNMFETIQRVFFFKGKGIVHVPCTVQQLKRLNFASILTTVHW